MASPARMSPSQSLSLGCKGSAGLRGSLPVRPPEARPSLWGSAFSNTCFCRGNIFEARPWGWFCGLTAVKSGTALGNG